MLSKELNAKIQTILSTGSLDEFKNDEALILTGALIDLSEKDGDRLEFCLTLINKFGKRTLSEVQKTRKYFIKSNCFAYLRQLKYKEDQIWSWIQPERKQEIIQLRLAVKSKGFTKIDKQLKCRILTNLGNSLNSIGRFVESMEYWKLALNEIPSFGMAAGNLGACQEKYSNFTLLYEHYYHLTKSAIKNTKLGFTSNDPDVYLDAKIYFQYIHTKLSARILKKKPEEKKRQLTKKEKNYRQWCAKSNLFLNPANDAGIESEFLLDNLHLLSISGKKDEGPYHFGFINQMIQEYVFSRYTLYDGLNSNSVHFSDKGVNLLDTFDYSIHSFSVEQIKTSLRISYSTLDKVAFFLNDYFELNMPANKVNFQGIWSDSENTLREQFVDLDNLPLRGLYWLGHDIYDKENRDSLEPDAHLLSDIRNHIEHKYIKVRHSFGTEESESFKDPLALPISLDLLEAKATKMLRFSRAALIYLILGIQHEEEKKRKSETGLRYTQTIEPVKDNFKRRM